MDVFSLFPGGLSVETFRSMCCEGCHYDRSYVRFSPAAGEERPVHCKVISQILEAMLEGKPAPASVQVKEHGQTNLLPGSPQSQTVVVCQRYLAKKRFVRRARRKRGPKIAPGQMAMFG